MKKFFIYAAILLALLVAADYGVGRVFKAIDGKLLSYPIDYHNSYEKTMGGGNSEDMIIIGHSRARHHYIPTLIEDSLGLSVVNAAKDGTGFLTQAVLIHGMVQQKAPKYILWEVRPAVFLKADNREIDRLTDLMPFYDTDSLSRVWVQRRSPSEKYKMLSWAYRNNGRFWGRMEQMLTGKEDNGRKGYAPAKPSKKHPEMKRYEYEDNYDPERAALFVDVVNSTRRAGTQLIMAISPQYETSNAYELEETRQFYALTDSLNIPVLDFFYNPEFLDHPEWFKDHTHLNSSGAEHYMEVFIPELKRTIANAKQ